MTLEQQVTSLEISKRLKELGVKQESLFNWNEIKTGPPQEPIWGWEVSEKRYSLRGIDGKSYSAFTVAELGEMLHEATEKMGGKMIHSTSARTQQMIRRVGNFEDEANTRGKMLIYLLENKLITI